jgi:uncharacterized protein (DUF302 family)
MAEIGMTKVVRGSFEDVLGRIPDALTAEGFGVLTRIDVKATMREKLGVEFRKYQILGACNPRYAHQALGAEIGIGVMLPCNVAVWEEDGGAVVVSAVDPMQTIAATRPALAPIAAQVRERLAAALVRLPS